jgi:hypothetical protein
MGSLARLLVGQGHLVDDQMVAKALDVAQDDAMGKDCP